MYRRVAFLCGGGEKVGMMKLLAFLNVFLITITKGEVKDGTTPTILSSATNINQLITGYQTIVITIEKKEIIGKANKIRQGLITKLEDKTRINIKNTDQQGNETATDQYQNEYYHPFLKHLLWRNTLLTHEIITAENFLHILSMNYEISDDYNFLTLPYIKADESDTDKIPIKTIDTDKKVLNYISKMRKTSTMNLETYKLEISILGETLKKVLNTNNNQLTIFCTGMTQKTTLDKALSQYVTKDNTLEVIKNQLEEIKLNFLERITTLFPELNNPQTLSREKRNLWGSFWSTVYNVPSNEEVETIKHNTELLLTNEREITQKFKQFDATNKLIAKNLLINEENFERIRNKENQIANFLHQEEITQQNLKRKFRETMSIANMAIDEINTILMFLSDLEDLTTMAKELTQTVNTLLGTPSINHIPVTRLNPSIFRNPRFLEENRPIIEANMTHYSTSLRIPYSTKIECRQYQTLPIIADNKLYQLEIPKYIAIHKGKIYEVDKCKDLENVVFIEPDDCIKAMINESQFDIPINCPIRELKRENKQFALISTDKIIVLATEVDIMVKNCLDDKDEINIKEGYNEIYLQATCEYTTKHLYVPPQHKANRMEVSVHFDKDHFNLTTLNFPTIDSKKLPPISEMVLEKGDVEKLKFILDNTQGEISLMFFDLNNKIHLNVMIVNIILITGIVIWSLVRIYKCKTKFAKRARRVDTYRMKTPDIIKTKWAIKKGDLGEYLLINQQENLVYHPIKEEVINTKTLLKVDKPKTPPWTILKEYQTLLQTLKQTIVPNTNGEYTIRIGQSEITYDKEEGDWIRGDTKIIGFPEP